MAVQVRVMRPVLPHAAANESAKVMTIPSQASVAVAWPMDAGLVSPGHSIVLSDGTVRIGATLSSTLTPAVQLALLPLASVAMSVTLLFPTFEQSKAVLLSARLTPPQLSLLPLST